MWHWWASFNHTWRQHPSGQEDLESERNLRTWISHVPVLDYLPNPGLLNERKKDFSRIWTSVILKSLCYSSITDTLTLTSAFLKQKRRCHHCTLCYSDLTWSVSESRFEHKDKAEVFQIKTTRMVRDSKQKKLEEQPQSMSAIFRYPKNWQAEWFTSFCVVLGVHRSRTQGENRFCLRQRTFLAVSSA